MKYKMIFSDMDGTLLKDDYEVSQGNRDAIEKAVAMGTSFVVCTGRGAFGVVEVLKQMNLMGKEGYAICQNGGTVYNLKNMELEIRHGFSSSILLPVAKRVRELALEIYYYDDFRFMAEKETARVRKYCAVMSTEMHLLKEPTDYDGSFTKCLITGPREKLLALRKEISYLEETEIDIFFSSPIFMEIVKKGVNKGRAMAEIAEKVSVSLDEVIAVGDGDNDIPMIRCAGLGIAVANAEDEVKAVAKHITKRRYDEDAIAEVIEEFIL